MTYKATIEFKFNSTYTPDYESGLGSTIDDDFLPEENLVITASAADLNTRQYFKLFEKFLLAVGMSSSSIHEGAMSLVFNDWVKEADQRKVCKNFELTMNGDLQAKSIDWKEWHEELEKISQNSKIDDDLPHVTLS